MPNVPHVPAPCARSSRWRRLTAVCAVVLAGGALATSATAAERFEPPDGQVLSGASPEYPSSNLAKFAALTGQPGVAVYHTFGDFLAPFSKVFPDTRGADAATMISWRLLAANPSQAGGTLASVANGDVDSYLVAQAAEARGYGRPIFVRINWEMTGDWFPWSAYDSSGNARPGNSPASFRQSWQRARIIFDGGTKAQIDGRLAAAGMPGLKASVSSLAQTSNVAFVWSPAKGGVKQKKGPVTADYYPGDDYVDWVALDFHAYSNYSVAFVTSQINNAGDPLDRTNDFYNEYSVRRGKPAMVTEWGIAAKPYGNGDDPTWIRDVFTWIAAHPKVKAQVYFNRQAGSNNHKLESHPAARAEFAAGVKRVGSVHDWRRIPSSGATPLPLVAPAPAAPAPAATKPKPKTKTPGSGAPPGRACSMSLVNGSLTANRAKAARGTFAGRRMRLLLRGTPRWIRGTIRVGNPRHGVIVKVNGKRVRTNAKAGRARLFGSRLASGDGTHRVVVLMRKGRRTVERINVTVATTTEAVAALPPLQVCLTSRPKASNGRVKVSSSISGARNGVRNARLVVNGRRAGVARGAARTWTVGSARLRKGENTVRIVARDRSGRKATGTVVISR